MAVHAPGWLLAVMFAGQVMDRGVISFTVNVLEQVLEFKVASLTVIVTVVVPTPTRAPAAGDWVMVKEPDAVQLSVAVTPAVKSGTAAWQLAFAFAVKLEPQALMIGTWVSFTVTVNEHVVVLPLASVT